MRNVLTLAFITLIAAANVSASLVNPLLVSASLASGLSAGATSTSSSSTASSFTDKYHAEVWLLSMSIKLKPYIKNPQERLELLKKIHLASTKVQLQPELILAVIQIESSFNPYAVSRVGAQGLMQVMPFWKKEIGSTDDNLIDTETNLHYGSTILKRYLDREKGDHANALARYNGSYGSYKYSRKVMNAWLDYWQDK